MGVDSSCEVHGGRTIRYYLYSNIQVRGVNHSYIISVLLVVICKILFMMDKNILD